MRYEAVHLPLGMWWWVPGADSAVPSCRVTAQAARRGRLSNMSWCCCFGSHPDGYHRHDSDESKQETAMANARRNWQQTWLTVITLVRRTVAACNTQLQPDVTPAHSRPLSC